MQAVSRNKGADCPLKHLEWNIALLIACILPVRPVWSFDKLYNLK
jgi:hypothetical protein